VTIRGFTLQNGRRGVLAERAKGVLVESNIIRQNLRQGVLIWEKSEGKVLNNQIVENLPDADGTQGRGLNVTDSKVVISGNNISNNAEFGIIVFFSIVEVNNNQITGNAKDGVSLNESVDGLATPAVATLTGNKINGNKQFGLSVYGAAKITVSNNQITDNNSYGVLLRGKTETSGTVEGAITSNTITGNAGIGIYLYELVKVEISKNQVTNTKSLPNPNDGAGDGIFLARGANAKVLENTITGNARNGVVVSGPSVAHLDSNVIKANQGCGVAGGGQATITGSNNELSGNAEGDLCGSAPASLKK